MGSSIYMLAKVYALDFFFGWNIHKKSDIWYEVHVDGIPSRVYEFHQAMFYVTNLFNQSIKIVAWSVAHGDISYFGKEMGAKEVRPSRRMSCLFLLEVLSLFNQHSSHSKH